MKKITKKVTKKSVKKGVKKSKGGLSVTKTVPTMTVTSMAPGSGESYITTASGNFRARNVGDGNIRIHIPATVVRLRPEYVAMDIRKADIIAILNALA